MRSFSVATLLVGVAALVVSASCSLTTSFSGVDSQPAPARVPGRPSGSPTPSTGPTSVRYFGVKHFHFDHSNDALKIPGAWQDWGFDLDHLCTGADATQESGTCIRNSAEEPVDVEDGKLCRDNQFGHHVWPMLIAEQTDFEANTNGGLELGTTAWVFEIDDLDPASNDPYAPGSLSLAAPTPSHDPPSWDGTDQRSILSSLPNSTAGSPAPKVDFPGAYLINDTWVSGEPADFTVYLPIGSDGTLLPLALHSAVITMQLSSDHFSVIDGTTQLGGAVAVSDLEAFFAPYLANEAENSAQALVPVCPGTTSYQSFISQVQAFTDVVIGAPNLQDSTQSCDGVSIGFGMNMAPIAVPTAMVAGPPAANACATVVDAGTDVGVSEAAPDDESGAGGGSL